MLPGIGRCVAAPDPSPNDPRNARPESVATRTPALSQSMAAGDLLITLCRFGLSEPGAMETNDARASLSQLWMWLSVAGSVADAG